MCRERERAGLARAFTNVFLFAGFEGRVESGKGDERLARWGLDLR